MSTVTMSTVNDRAWVATRKGLFELRRQRDRRWGVVATSFLGEPVTAVLPPDDQGRMLAALNLGHFGVKLHASDDAGRSWTEVATPIYPAQPAGSEGPAWSLVQIWTLVRGHDGVVWAGTLPGGLFRSDDMGRSWSLNQSLWNEPSREEWFGGGNVAPGIHSVCVHPTRRDELIIAVSCGGAWLSQDNGASWAVRCEGMAADYMPPDRVNDPVIQDPHRIQRCTASPEVLWCQHHNGIWRSVDNAANWLEVKAPVSSFGFAVAAHPLDPLTAWFVPAEADQRRVPVGGALIVNRTRDGGRTFETLRRGLPQHHTYDLIYRHGLCVGPDGNDLLMGSTTGQLWTSADGGDDWSRLDANLPMIHAVDIG